MKPTELSTISGTYIESYHPLIRLYYDDIFVKKIESFIIFWRPFLALENKSKTEFFEYSLLQPLFSQILKCDR